MRCLLLLLLVVALVQAKLFLQKDKPGDKTDATAALFRLYRAIDASGRNVLCKYNTTGPRLVENLSSFLSSKFEQYVYAGKEISLVLDAAQFVNYISTRSPKRAPHQTHAISVIATMDASSGNACQLDGQYLKFGAGAETGFFSAIAVFEEDRWVIQALYEKSNTEFDFTFYTAWARDFCPVKNDS